MATWPINSNRYAPNAPDSTDLWSDVISQIVTLTNNNGSISFLNGAPTISNGSFEVNAQGGLIQPPAWTFNNAGNASGQVTTNFTGFKVDHGKWCYQIELATATGSADAQLFYGSSTVPSASNVTLVISPTESYRLHFDYLSTSTTVGLQVTVYWFTATGASSTPTSIVPLFTTTPAASVNAWQGADLLLLPPADATQMAFMIEPTATSGGGNVFLYVDNVYCTLRPAFMSFSYSTSSAAPYAGSYAASAIQLYSLTPGQLVKTLTSTFTVPQGVRTINTRIYGASLANTNNTFGGSFGGYVEAPITVIPGTTATITIDGFGSVTFVINNLTYKAFSSSLTGVRGGGGVGSGSATAPTGIALNNFSMSLNAMIVITF